MIAVEINENYMTVYLIVDIPLMLEDIVKRVFKELVMEFPT